MVSKISWLEGGDVWNPVTGCTPASGGCENCYAKRIATRMAGRCGYEAIGPFHVTLHRERVWGCKGAPFQHWKKPRKIFVCSMGDLFHEMVPNEFIDDVFYQIRAFGGQHTFIFLTKRPSRMKDWVLRYLSDPAHWRAQGQGKGLPELPKNIWMGVSAENQVTANERIPVLLQIPAAVRLVSVEPMLEMVDLRYFLGINMGIHDAAGDGEAGHPNRGKLHWVIAGGESGPGARPCQIEWFRILRFQCWQAGIPFFMKQDWGPRSGMQGDIPDRLWACKEVPR